MNVGGVFMQLFKNAENKEESGNIVEAISDYRKMLCLLSGESLRSSEYSSFTLYSQLQNTLSEKIQSLSQTLLLDGVIFKIGNVEEQFKFSLDNISDTNSFLQSSFIANEPLNTPTQSSNPPIPQNAPKLQLLFGDDKAQSQEEEERVTTIRSKKSFSYSKGNEERERSRNTSSSFASKSRFQKRNQPQIDSDEEQEKPKNPFKTGTEVLVISFEFFFEFKVDLLTNF